MKNYQNMKLIFVSPEEFRMENDILDFLRKHNISSEETTDFRSAIKEADAIYMTRIQDEHDRSKGESAKIDCSTFHFKKEHLSLIKPTCVIMHPLPRRYEIEPAVDADPRAVYWRQERNGMWARAALISYIFKVEDKIH